MAKSWLDSVHNAGVSPKTLKDSHWPMNSILVEYDERGRGTYYERNLKISNTVLSKIKKNE